MPTLRAVKLTPAARIRLRDYLQSELNDCLAARPELEAKWKEDLLQWRAKNDNPTTDYPWPGASDIEMPLTGMHSDPVYADMRQTLGAAEDYWTPVAIREDRVEHATPLRKALTAIDRRYLHMRRVNKRAMIDNNVLGTAIYKNHWRVERRPRYDRNGNRTVRFISVPTIDPVPLQHFYIPATAWDIDPDAATGGAAWVAQHIDLRPEQLRERIDNRDLLYDRKIGLDVITWASQPSDTIDETIRREDSYQPPKFQIIRLYEIHVRFDVDDDGLEEDVIILWHHETASIVRAIHKPFLHGRPDFYATTYMPGPGFYGVGISELDRWAQLTVSDILNGFLNNLAISNAIMVSAPEGSSINPNEPIYPGKVWFTRAGEPEVKGIKLGEVNPYIMAALGQLVQFADLRVGKSDVSQGSLDNLPSRTPATTVMSMLNESKKRFDMMLSDVRDIHGEMGLRLLQNIAQDYNDSATSAVAWEKFFRDSLGDASTAKVIEVLAGEIDDIETSFGITVTATSALTNKEAEKQGFVGMMQTIIPMFQSLVQTGMMLGGQVPPGTPAYEAAAASFSAGVQLIERLLERFDIPNVSQYTGNLQNVASQLNPPAQQGMAAPGGVAMSPYPTPGVPQMPFGPAQMGALFGL